MRAALLLTALVFACAQPSPRLRNVAPGVIRGTLTYPSGQKPSEQAVNSAQELLLRLIEMVNRKDWSGLPDLVSPQKGIYVDLKGFRSLADLRHDVADRKSYLYVFYHNTEDLRAFTHDPGQIAVRDVLLSTDQIRVDYYFEEGGQQCEMRLHLVGNEGEDFRLNQPVFILEGGVWKVYRLF